jgi:hypothetical protein
VKRLIPSSVLFHHPSIHSFFQIPATQRESLFTSTILPRLAQCVVKSTSVRAQVQALIAISHVVETKHVNASATERTVVPALKQCLSRACGSSNGAGAVGGGDRPASDPAVLMCCLGGMHACAKLVTSRVVANEVSRGSSWLYVHMYICIYVSIYLYISVFMHL